MQQNVQQKSPIPMNAVVPIVAAILYGVSPLDLIPDIVPILGLLDDVIAIPLFIVIALMMFMKRKQQNAQTAAAPANSQVVPTVPNIPDQY